MSQTINQLKRQMAVLDVLPFAYNFASLVVWFIDPASPLVAILTLTFGYSLTSCSDLLHRSLDNNYCVWHQVPVYNMFMLCGFNILHQICLYYFSYNLLADIQYPILYGIFSIWWILFVISAVIFTRKRLKKTYKRCL